MSIYFPYASEFMYARDFEKILVKIAFKSAERITETASERRKLKDS